MSDWLTIVLAMLAGGVLFVGLLLFSIKFFLGRFLKGLLAMGSGAPVRLTTEALSEPAIWKKPRLIQQSRGFFEGHGFRWVSDMQIAEMEGLLCCCLVDERGAGVVLYDHAKLGFWIDIFLGHGERGGLTVTSQAQGKSLKCPPFSQKFIQPAAGAQELWDLYQEQSQSVEPSSIRPLTVQSFLKDFEAAYADEMDWRNAQGGPTRHEVRLTLEEAGTNPTEEEVEEAWQTQARLASLGLGEGIQQRLQDSLSEQDRLRFRPEELLGVHDQLEELDLLEDLMAYITDEEYMPTELPAACRGLKAREAFTVLQSLLPEEVRFEKVCELTFPLDVDFYLPPRGSIPVELFPHKKIDDDDC